MLKSKTPRSEQGLTLFFTGLPGAGKATIAEALMAEIKAYARKPVTLLDGDKVRSMLSRELGFSREHRDLNILRIGFVAAEITRHSGIAICAVIAPYARTRETVRERISKLGAFAEIYVATPLEVCEQRDPKGMYMKARAGLIPNFTGISDPYEPPRQPGNYSGHEQFGHGNRRRRNHDIPKSEGLFVWAEVEQKAGSAFRPGFTRGIFCLVRVRVGGVVEESARFRLLHPAFKVGNPNLVELAFRNFLTPCFCQAHTSRKISEKVPPPSQGRRARGLILAPSRSDSRWRGSRPPPAWRTPAARVRRLRASP